MDKIEKTIKAGTQLSLQQAKEAHDKYLLEIEKKLVTCLEKIPERELKERNQILQLGVETKSDYKNLLVNSTNIFNEVQQSHLNDLHSANSPKELASIWDSYRTREFLDRFHMHTSFASIENSFVEKTDKIVESVLEKTNKNSLNKSDSKAMILG